jgi:hypothetical protein
MTLNITSFKVVEPYVLRDTLWNKFRKWLRDEQSHNLYHFDCEIQVDDESRLKLVGLDAYKEFIELPNKVRLQVWAINHRVLKCKTYKFVDKDLRRYHPTKMYLVYDRRHGHINDRT